VCQNLVDYCNIADVGLAGSGYRQVLVFRYTKMTWSVSMIAPGWLSVSLFYDNGLKVIMDGKCT